MAYWDKEEQISEDLPKNKSEKSRITITELKGKRYIHITNLKDKKNDGVYEPIGGTSIVISDQLKELWPELTKKVMEEK